MVAEILQTISIIMLVVVSIYSFVISRKFVGGLKTGFQIFIICPLFVGFVFLYFMLADVTNMLFSEIYLGIIEIIFVILLALGFHYIYKTIKEVRE